MSKDKNLKKFSASTRVIEKNQNEFLEKPLPTPPSEDALSIKIIGNLRSQLDPTHLKIENESHKHKNHKGALSGGHFKLMIVSPLFRGLTKLERSRWVYSLLNELIQGGQIHALALELYDPEEKPF